jgi:hypothetical protein
VTTVPQPTVPAHQHDDYAWPTCTTPTCRRDLWVSEAGRHACRPCQAKTLQRLTDLPGLFAQLDTTANHARGSRRPGAATSGSKTPPIPVRLEVLALTGPGGIAARLAAIEDAWRRALGWTIAPWRGNPTEAVPAHTRFLLNNLPWACDAYDSVGQDIDDIRRLHAETLSALTQDQRPGRVTIGLCPTPLDTDTGVICGQELTAATNNHRIHCHACGTRWEGLDDWRRLRTAQQHLTGAAA